MQQTAPLTPELFFETATAFQRSAAMKAAVELDLFSKIGEGNHTAREIAEACEASERGVRILCDVMTILGFLKKEDSRYDLNDMSAAFLNRQSPAYLGDAIHFLMSPLQRRGFDNLTEAVRRGGTAVAEEGALEPDNPMWVKFAEGMTGMMMPAAQMIAEQVGFETDRRLKVLDIAAGHGIFGIMIAQKYPNSEIHAVDWANVLEVAKENANKFGISDRYRTIEGSAFDVEFGEGYDVVLLTNFLHHFDKQTCENLLRKIRKSLTDDGKVITLEFVPNDDRVSPPHEAFFSLVMLASTPAGDAYTFSELREMFENAGFSRNEHVQLHPLPQHLVISEL